MKRPFLVAALGVLVVSNGFVLFHVGMNRRGEPEAEVDLTSRELSRDYVRGDDSRVSMTLHWQNTAPEYPEFHAPPSWFNEQKLKETGFDVREATHGSQNSRTREVFVALEFDGPAWQHWLEQREANLRSLQQAEIQTQMEVQRRTASRLVAIDVGLDPEALRRRYPDRKRVIVLRGLARAILESGGHLAFLRGAITQISNDEVNVPMPFSELISIAPVNSYAVTLRVGQRYEPWISDLRRLLP